MPVLSQSLVAGQQSRTSTPAGEPLVNVSRWLGHRKISTTERWYVHQIESADDLAAERMRERYVG